MIDNALKFVANEVNKYLIRKTDSTQDATIVKMVVTGNVAKAYEQDTTGGQNPLAGKAILTLVNIEEDRVSKSPENFRRDGDRIIYKNPKLYLNLYCLFSANHSTYDTSLQYLSLIMQFFQYRNVINHANSPSSGSVKLDEKIEKLVFDMISMNFEQVNHLWGTLGGKYLPSVLYKVRMVTIEDDTPDSVATAISGVGVSDANTN
jgi:hypothetical protein